tara:strand:+ start:17730 stop:17948 length:219 start_codon:yes stop_codon:yes gene_type:complete
MSIPAKDVLTPSEIKVLERKGWQPSRYFPSTGEILLTHNGAPYGLRLIEVRRMAKPSAWDRLTAWMNQGVAS